MDTISTRKSSDYLRNVRRDLHAAGIPFTVHWGKLETWLTANRLRGIYGDALDRWIAARHEVLENADVARVFTNKFMTRLGLA